MRINCSNRIKKIQGYLFAEIDRAIARKKSHGVDVIELGIGDPDLPTPKNIINKMCEAVKDPKNHQYPSYVGMLKFRESVSRWYKKRFNVNLNPENEIVTLIGSKEGIAHIPLAFVNAGDITLVPDPAYPVYRIGTIIAGGNPIAMPLLEKNDFRPDFDKIDKKTAKKAKLMFLNYPNNPTAATVEKEFFKEVVDFASENNIIVCHDAPYSELSFDDYRAPSFLEINGAKDVGVEFHSLSKTYNMTGWRLGFAVGNSEIIKGLGKVKENIDSGVFQAVQLAGVEALEGSQQQIRKNIKIFEERRNLMVDGLNEIGFDVRRPKATFYLWFRIPKKYRSSVEFCKKLLDETGVVMTPGVGFGRYGEGYVRCTITQSKERLLEALSRIRKAKLI